MNILWQKRTNKEKSLKFITVKRIPNQAENLQKINIIEYVS